MTDKQQPEALRSLYEITHNITDLNTVLIDRGALNALHSENTALQAGYAAARLEIESLRGRSVEPAGEYPALQDAAGVVVEHVPVGGGWVRHYQGASYTAYQMRAYVDADRAMRAAQPAGAQQPGAAYAALPECSAFLFCKGSDVTARAWNADQMRAFADATCALRATPAQFARGFEAAKSQFASHGQAPAQAAPAAVAGPSDLRTRCEEILAWRKTGVLPGEALRILAREKYGDEYDAIQRAERDTETEALNYVIAAPTTQPAPQQEAQEPVAWAPGANLFKDWCAQWFGPDSDDGYLAKAVFDLPPMAQVFKRAAPQPSPASQGDALDAARWRWLSEHIQVAWNEGKFTSLVRIVSEQHRQSLNASVDRMMAGDWSDADAARAHIKRENDDG